MKFKTSSDVFLTSLEPLLSIVPQRTPYNVLKNHLKMTAEKKKIKILATNIETTGELSFDADVEKEGEIVIPVKKLTDFLRKIPSSELSIEAVSGKLNFMYDKGYFHLPTVMPDEFPEIPEVVPEKEILFNPRMLKKMVDKTAFAINTIGATSPIVDGIYWKFKGKNTEMVGASNHRLAKFSNEVQINADFSVIIPQKFLVHVSSYVEEEDIKISLGQERISFHIPEKNLLLTSRLINFNFPDYSKIIFDSSKHKFQVNKKTIYEVIARISIFSDSLSFRIKLFFDKDNKLEISSSSTESGEAKETIEYMRNSKGNEKIKIPINYHYITDILKNIESEDVLFLINETDKAIEIVPAEEDPGEKVVYILMPLHSKD
ncbi:DNA polymerase III subunit beta [candidate division WOR-3 bacterium]|nr:DNA polymerase III subunit beta [candidate division WOR-3 bacterium]